MSAYRSAGLRSDLSACSSCARVGFIRGRILSANGLQLALQSLEFGTDDLPDTPGVDVEISVRQPVSEIDNQPKIRDFCGDSRVGQFRLMKRFSDDLEHRSVAVTVTF